MKWSNMKSYVDGRECRLSNGVSNEL